MVNGYGRWVGLRGSGGRLCHSTRMTGTPPPELGCCGARRAAGCSREIPHIGLLQLARVIRRGSALLYSRVSGLSVFEWRVLARVCDLPGLSINELGLVLECGVTQVSRSVKRLVGIGLLRRDSVAGGPGVAIGRHPPARPPMPRWWSWPSRVTAS